MKLRFSCLMACIFSLLAFPALALDLHSARRSGQIGEKSDGYVEALVARPEVQALAKDVNSKRSQEYARIAQSKGQPADIVAKLAAQEIIGGLEPGSMYQSSGGEWKKR